MKITNTAGKRKRAIARATLKPGNGKVIVNNQPLEIYQPKINRLKIEEPLLIAKDFVDKNIDIYVTVRGGGYNGQAEAARLAIARALLHFDKKLEKLFLDYDRHLLVADVRRKETAKPNRHGNARSKRQKSYR
jgi:small subunit ribosomal protein S9|tara:strand:+ start:1637 stop:2035 length:399 start_codon:yes stop_codon:yes gene_type:complete